MKKAANKKSKPELEKLPDDAMDRYDWSKATRGRYAGKLASGTPWRRLDEDLAEAFPTSNDVNEALRAVLALRSLLPGRRPTKKRPAA